MGANAKRKGHDHRKNEKAKRKAAKRAQYETFKATGQNQKSKRVRLRVQRRSVVVRAKHPHYCGNHACHVCFPIDFKPFLRDGEPHQMPQWMYRIWKAKQVKKEK